MAEGVLDLQQIASVLDDGDDRSRLDALLGPHRHRGVFGSKALVDRHLGAHARSSATAAAYRLASCSDGRMTSASRSTWARTSALIAFRVRPSAMPRRRRSAVVRALARR